MDGVSLDASTRRPRHRNSQKTTIKITFTIRVLLGLLRYMLARGMDLWRRGASIREYGNENVELPLRATSSLTRRAIPEPLKVPPDRD